MSNDDPIIQVENFTFGYPSGETALNNVNLQINKGEFVVVMGPNGAGKTTLAYSLNGVIPSIITGNYSGTVTVCGMNVVEHYVYELGQKIGIVLQDPESQLFLPDVKSEIVFSSENLGVPREELQVRLDYALEMTRMEGMEERFPHQLSGGQKQRLALAAAIATRPEVLILDEPTSQLDPIGATELFSVVADLNKKHNMTIVMVEHKSEEVVEFANRVILLDHGKIVMDGAPQEVFSEISLLKKIGVKIPQVSDLATKLVLPGKFPITLDEGINTFSKLLKQITSPSILAIQE